MGDTTTRQTRVESIGKHRKGFIFTSSDSRGTTTAALNHVSKQVPKNDYFCWHLQYKQTRSGDGRGGCIYMCMYVCICIYIYMHACMHTSTVASAPTWSGERSRSQAAEVEAEPGRKLLSWWLRPVLLVHRLRFSYDLRKHRQRDIYRYMYIHVYICIHVYVYI